MFASVLILVAALGAVLSLWISKPERKGYAVAATLAALVPAAWQAADAYSTNRQLDALRRHVCDHTSRETHRVLHVLSEAIMCASDEWLPSTRDEFFSRRTADLLCQNVNIEKDGSVIPRRSWGDWLAGTLAKYRSFLGETLSSEDAAQLDEQMIRASSELQLSILLGFDELISARRVSAAEGFQGYPPQMCHGLENDVADALAWLGALYSIVDECEVEFALRRTPASRRFPMPQRDSRLGACRLTPEDVAKWMEQHPGAPGPRIR